MQIASLQQQVISVKSSMEKLAGIQTAVEQEVKGGNVALSSLNQSLIYFYDELSQHVDYLKGGSSKAEATFATLEVQKKAAEIVAALVANDLCVTATKSLSESVKTWVGTSFEVYYEAALLRGQTLVELNRMRSAVSDQKISLDAMYSDVEAGLREGVEAEEIAAVSSDVQKNESAVELLISQVDQAMETLENECNVAVSALCEATENYNMSSLKKAGAQAVAQMRASAGTLADLVARVEACETQVEAIRSKLGELEANVDQLLEMIQSVSFLSDYSSDYAVAYYEMGNTKVSAPGKTYDGKNIRTATGTFELSFMVRPASAAAAVTAQTASIFGYYADHIQTRAVDPSKFINLQIQSVSVTSADRGIVTVKVSHNLKDDFYYKETGAKCALSIATGKTDITSKFIELVPKDNTTTVYVEGVKINQDDFEIDEGQTKNLTATVNPSSATNKTIKWTSSNTEIATIDQYSGVLTAVKQGNVTITATTNGIDEWGDNLTASVNVKVNPSIRLGGPLYVEVGKTAELSLDFPPAMNIESKVWMSSDETKATVKDGIVTGVAHSYNEYTYQYNPVTITCIVNGNITLTHSMDVAIVQPRNIVLSKLDDSKNLFEIKVDQNLDLSATTSPLVDLSNQFDMYYEVDNSYQGLINFDTGMFNAYNRELPVGTATVTITVKNYDKHHYLKTGELKRYVNVRVLPYYVKSISIADAELEPNSSVTLNPTLISDVSGKQPTNTKLNWESSNTNIATVDDKGLVTALSEGSVTITASATDGSGVKGSCKITITSPWKSFEIGDYVVRTSGGDIEFAANLNTAKSKGSVVGVVVAKTNPRASDPKLPTSCTHGVAVALGEGQGNWWSGDPSSSPYKVYEWAVQNGYQSTMGADWSSSLGTYRSGTADLFVGYNNTLALQSYFSVKGLTSGIINALTAYRSNSSTPTLPNGASPYYLPSVAEMDAIAAYSNMSFVLSNKLKDAGGTQFTNMKYWTVSENGNSYSQAVEINPLTGEIGVRAKTSTADGYGDKCRVRFVFAF